MNTKSFENLGCSYAVMYILWSWFFCIKIHILLSAKNKEHFCWWVRRDFFHGNILPQWHEYSALPWTTSMWAMSSWAVETNALHRQHWTVNASLQLFWWDNQATSSMNALLQTQQRYGCIMTWVLVCFWRCDFVEKTRPQSLQVSSGGGSRCTLGSSSLCLVTMWDLRPVIVSKVLAQTWQWWPSPWCTALICSLRRYSKEYDVPHSLQLNSGFLVEWASLSCLWTLKWRLDL